MGDRLPLALNRYRKNRIPMLRHEYQNFPERSAIDAVDGSSTGIATSGYGTKSPFLSALKRVCCRGHSGRDLISFKTGISDPQRTFRHGGGERPKARFTSPALLKGIGVHLTDRMTMGF
jgi:hypothetical protein